MCWGVRMCPCMYLETRVQHPCSLLLSTFFSLLLCFTFENFIDVYNEYIYCFPFHSILIITKCPLCNFMGLSLLSFCFANPLRPVGAVHMFIGVEPFPGGWESTNGQTRTILSPQQLIPVHSSLWGGPLESISSIQPRMLVKLSLCRFPMSVTTVAVCSHCSPSFTSYILPVCYSRHALVW